MNKEYNKWNEIKKQLAIKEKNLDFKNREIFWMKVGQNIGFETDGKGEEFLRPVLILRKFSKDSFQEFLLRHQIKMIYFIIGLH